MFGGFSANKLKPHLKMAVNRFQIASNKKSALLKQQMREVAQLLNEDPPREEKARIRAEAIIRDDNLVEAYEILQLECELLAERIKLIASTKDCPPDLISCISTLMWATDRVDIPELVQIRKQFRSKYGKKFEENAMNNMSGVLNERVVSKLSVQPPAAYLVQTYLERIADQYEVAWEPKVKLTAAEMAEPMRAPDGTSVPIAPATGFGHHEIPVVTGTPNADEEINYNPKANGGAPAGSALPPPVVPVVAPYIPPSSATSSVTASAADFPEVDIYIPAAPTSDPSSGKPKDDDNNNDGGSGDPGYDDLAARFNALKK